MSEFDSRMTSREKLKTSILIIEKDTAERNNLKTALKTVGFENISDSPDQLAALEKLEQRHFSHVIFNASEKTMPMDAFIAKLLEIENDVVAIAASGQPEIDNVFDMMIHGARGFLVKPFTFEGVENSITLATKGESINSLVLQAKDRNEALVAIVMSSIDNTANILRQSKQFETAKRDIPRYIANLHNSVTLAHTFAKDGTDGLLSSLQKFCIERSKGPATKLGRLRKKLQHSR